MNTYNEKNDSENLNQSSESTNTQTDSVSQTSYSQNLKNKLLSDRSRFITAIVLVAILIVVLSIDYPPLTCVILGGLCVVGVKEALNLYKLESALHYYIATIFIWVLAYFNESPIESCFVALLVYASYLAYTKSIQMKVLLVFIYPVLPFLTIWTLYRDAEGAGVWVIVWLIVVVALTDIGAYFGGKALGKTPFCPTSPKKTLEGVICGVACGVIIGSFVGIGTCGGFLPSALITFAVSIASVFGDLFESYLKREADVKDSGTIFPGHGGVLDRFDAIFFGAIMMHFLLSFLPGYRDIFIPF